MSGKEKNNTTAPTNKLRQMFTRLNTNQHEHRNAEQYTPKCIFGI